MSDRLWLLGFGAMICLVGLGLPMAMGWPDSWWLRIFVSIAVSLVVALAVRHMDHARQQSK
jgi:urea transporter